MTPKSKVTHLPTNRIGVYKRTIRNLKGEKCSVVFNCGGHWNDALNYTGEFVRVADLVEGWPEPVLEPAK